jgi:hypothetical protein
VVSPTGPVELLAAMAYVLYVFTIQPYLLADIAARDGPPMRQPGRDLGLMQPLTSPPTQAD